MFRVEFGLPAPYLLLCLAAAVGLAYLMYRKAARKPRWLWWLLMALRGAALFLLLALLLEPLITTNVPETHPPQVELLLDNSQSMAAGADSAYNRHSLPTELTKFTKRLAAEGIQVQPYALTGELNSLNDYSKLNYSGESTALAAALEETETHDRHSGAIVLVSDGIPTAGSNPIYTADHASNPIYTVLAGDTLPQKDLKLETVLYNEIAYLGNTTTVKATLNATGYSGPATLMLSQGRVIFAQKQVELTANTPLEVTLELPMKQVGLQVFTLSLSTIPGEQTYRNNTQGLYIHVLESRQNIVILAGSPHPDLGALTQCFASSDRYTVSSFVRKDEASYYNSPTPAQLAAADVFILHDYPGSTADRAVLEQVFDQVAKRHVPLLHFIGSQTRLNISPRQREFTPVFAEDLTADTPQSEAYLSLTPAYHQHSTYTFDDKFLKWLDGTPPLLRPDAEFQPVNGAQVYGTARIRGVALDYPMLVLNEQKNLKTIAFVGDNTWRYRLYSYAETGSFAYYDTWIQNLVGWLIAQQDRRRFRVYPAKPLFGGSDAITFKGQVYDESYNPNAGAEVKLTLTDSAARRQDYYLKEAAPGSYALTLPGLPEGSYSYTAEGNANGLALGKDAGQFTVGSSSTEYINLRADAELMRQVARRSGGCAYTTRQLDALAAELLKSPYLKPTLEYHKRIRGLNELLLPLLLALTCLSAEWVLRKRFGMV